jgi:hypothetical protein
MYWAGGHRRTSMITKKPVRRPKMERGCENCDHRGGDFTKDTVNEAIIRVYCRARHFSVNAEEMSKNCDFWAISHDYIKPKEDDNKYGL